MATTTTEREYTPKKWALQDLQGGISNETLEIHFGLYAGYVKNTNLLNQQIADLTAAGKASGADPGFAELVRRLGFEYNGMRLHEYYFDNLTSHAKPLSESSTTGKALGEAFGSVETFRKQFSAIGGMRGIGWAMLLRDPMNGRLSNHWITMHEEGNVAGFEPILVMDLWEHAYFRDFKPADKGKYVEAFFANVDWDTVDRRLAVKSGAN